MISDPDTSPAGPPPKRLDSANHFEVVVFSGGKALTIGRPPRVGEVIPKAVALVLAAWIVVQVDPDGVEFNRLLQEIKKS